MATKPGTSLGRYEIRSKIGEGGMGEVYLAQDHKLDRKVALKILPADVAVHPDRMKRFVREAKAASALNHPNIITIYEIDEAGSARFIATEFIEGETLRKRLRRGQITLSEALAVTTQVASALAAAHQAGIIHRDIKPENVMLRADGLVKVLDFGLVKLTAGARSDPEDETRIQSETEPGMIMGTVAYMSPEQARGLPVDQRTDVWSLGVMLYEMISGRQPFSGETTSDTVANILRNEPEPLHMSELPTDVARIVGKMLDKNPETRYATITDVVVDLKGLQKRIEFEAELWRTPLPKARAQAQTQMIDSAAVRADEGFWVAVLHFKYRGANAELETLAEGLSEDIVTGLSRFSYLRVIAHSSTLRFTSEATDIRSVGNELGARYVMEGSLRQAGAKLRLAVQLVDAKTGAHLWAENYERTFDPESIFELQDELVPRIVSTVADPHGVLLRSLSEAVRNRTPDQLSPYEAVLRSFGYTARLTPEELAIARSGVELAVEKAPAYADAWAMLALLCTHEYAQGFDLQSDSLTRGATAAQCAVEAGPSNHFAWYALAQARFFQKELQGFRDAAERAVALNPMDGATIASIGEMLIFVGDGERGLQLSGSAKQLNPHYPGWYWYANFYHAYQQKDYRSALGFARKVNLPGHWAQYMMIAAACGQLGDGEAAGKALRSLIDLRPDMACTVRKVMNRWWDSESVEHLIDGLRKAGLAISKNA